MAGSIKQNLRLALSTLLKPLIKLLISQGITHGDFSEVAKDVYVEMAMRRIDGEKVNKSKVSILTGLTRKEVANVISRTTSSDAPIREFSRPGRVLAGWHNDPEYTGAYGIPLDLIYESSNSGGLPSFTQLCKTYSGDIPPKSMLDELTRVGAVRIMENDTVKVLRRDFEPGSLSPAIIERFGDVGFNFISTISSNVEKDGRGSGPFDRVVVSDNKLTKEELVKFDTYLKVYLQSVLETIDIWLSVNVSDKKKYPTTEETFESGVAMVQYIEWNPEEKQTLHEFLLGQSN